jgi:predicted GNAT family acetyltransferase
MDVTNNRAERRFELMTDAGPAVAAYEVDGDTIVFTHTVVPREAEGRGVGSRLIAGALEQVRAEGVKIVPAMRVRARICGAACRVARPARVNLALAGAWSHC